MSNDYYRIADLKYIAAGAAILAGGGGEATGWSGAIPWKSTGSTVSVIKVNVAPALCKTPGVVASFAVLSRNIGYAGALPYPQEPGSGI